MASLLMAVTVVQVEAVQVTIQWNCNAEADMHSYALEMGRGSYWGLVSVIPYAPCTTSKTYIDLRDIAPGPVQYRLCAMDTSGNISATDVASITIPSVGPYSEVQLLQSACIPSSPLLIPPPPTNPTPPPQSGDYVYQAQFSGTQGVGQWSYRDTASNLLTFNGASNLWMGIQSYQGIWGSGFHPGTTNGTVVRWTAPEGGTATVSGSVQKYDLACGDGVTFEATYNGSTVKFTQAIGYSDGTAYPYSFSQAMTTGQTIDFIVTPGAGNSCDSTSLDPVIGWAPTSGAAPTISSFLPTSGAIGTSVIITGTNFIPSLTGNAVAFSGIAATVTAATATSITAIVSPHTVTGPLTVTTVTGAGTSGSNFTIPISGVVEPVNDVSVRALSTSTVEVQFTALSDGTGAAAKHDVRIAPSPIDWGTAPSVSSGTCSTPYAPGVINTVTTCTITGLTVGTQYDVQLVPYSGILNDSSVFGFISNIATVTTMGTVLDVPVICQVTDDLVLVADGCPKSDPREQVSLLHD